MQLFFDFMKYSSFVFVLLYAIFLTYIYYDGKWRRQKQIKAIKNDLVNIASLVKQLTTTTTKESFDFDINRKK